MPLSPATAWEEENKTKRPIKFAGNIGTKTSLFQQLNQKYNIPESAPHALSRKQFYYAFDVQDGFSTVVLPGFFVDPLAWHDQLDKLKLEEHLVVGCLKILICHLTVCS